VTWLKRTGVLVALLTALVAGSANGSHESRFAPACKAGYYKNVDAKCVRRPVKSPTVPAGATAKCRDGSYSFSLHASGTCSGHGGVAVWIHHP
jgi:hypothetical protein